MLPTAAPIREDISAGFVYESYYYTMDIIRSETLSVSDYYGVVLAYDVHSPESWGEVCNTYRGLRWARRYDGGIPVQFLLLGIDSRIRIGDWYAAPEHQVSRKEAEEFAQQNDCHFAECSARTGEGVHQAFELFVRHAHAMRMRFEKIRGVSDTTKTWLFESFDGF